MVTSFQYNFTTTTATQDLWYEVGTFDPSESGILRIYFDALQAGDTLSNTDIAPGSTSFRISVGSTVVILLNGDTGGIFESLWWVLGEISSTQDITFEARANRVSGSRTQLNAVVRCAVQVL